jgi:hypothetical protein
MTKLPYILAALASVAIITPSLSQDRPAAGTPPPATAPSNAGSPASAPGGEVKRDEGRKDEGRTQEKKSGSDERRGSETRRDGDRDGMRREGREEGRGGSEMRRDGDREGMRREGRGERREMRSGIRVELGEARTERRWHRRPARIVVIKRYRRHRHHH